MKILVTCPPMIGMIEDLRHLFTMAGAEVRCPNVVQTLSESDLVALVPQFDGWIIGDDPASRRVFEAGKKGKLRAAVKWGIGVDNVDLDAARELGLPITNTPGMFGREVADLAMGYVTALARHTHYIDQKVKHGQWVKPRGISLAERTLGLAGFGDVGRNVAKRALAADMDVVVFDPFFEPADGLEPVTPAQWPERLGDCDFLVLTCALTSSNRHMLNSDSLRKAKRGVRVVNVARGALIDEAALVEALDSGKVDSAALDVFDVEPLAPDSSLRKFERCIFGSHNGSNTTDAVIRASERAIALLLTYLAEKQV